MTRKHDGKIVVVTGASSGVGRALVRAFAREGAQVALLARNEDALNVAATEVRDAGGEALVLPLDVADAEAVDRAAAAVVDKWGRIDIWVNNAMATVFAPVADTTPEEYRRVTEVTYLGYVHGTLAALRRMEPRGQGTIIQIGSALAYRSIPLQGSYCAAKAAVRAFTDSLRTELIHSGSNIQLSMIQLPAVNTPQSLRQRNKLPGQAQPMPPMFSPEAIADVIVRVAAHLPREVLVGIPTLQAVWGQKLAPAALDWYLGKQGYDAQTTDEPNVQNGKDILFESLSGDPGAHGPYADSERGPDLQMRLVPHGRSIAVATGLVCLVALRAIGKRS